MYAGCGKFFKDLTAAGVYVAENRTPLPVFPVVTSERQQAYEQAAAQGDYIPMICGIHGRACRQMNDRKVQTAPCAMAASSASSALLLIAWNTPDRNAPKPFQRTRRPVNGRQKEDTMETFLRLFIIADIAYMVFMLSRPRCGPPEDEAREGTPSRRASSQGRNPEAGAGRRQGQQARAGRRTASQEARQAPQESAEAAQARRAGPDRAARAGPGGAEAGKQRPENGSIRR